jgi:hypothetical protein
LTAVVLQGRLEQIFSRAYRQEDETLFCLRLFLASVGLGLAVTMMTHATEPASSAKTPEPGLFGLPSDQAAPAAINNQQLANAIAHQLRQTGVLKNYQIDLTVRQGVVEIDGRVASLEQQAAVFNVIASVPGVERVVDRLTIHNGFTLAPAQHTLQPNQFGDPPIIGPPPRPEAGPTPPEPTPIFQAAPPPMPNAYQAPKMPPYAWPTYAPYNNYSRVAYPTTYPYNSWPFIGPMYPFPKIPPGWRSVNLTWRDGFWWYGRNSTGHEWWTTRYW